MFETHIKKYFVIKSSKYLYIQIHISITSLFLHSTTWWNDLWAHFFSIHQKMHFFATFKYVWMTLFTCFPTISNIRRAARNICVSEWWYFCKRHKGLYGRRSWREHCTMRTRESRNSSGLLAPGDVFKNHPKETIERLFFFKLTTRRKIDKFQFPWFSNYKFSIWC